MEQILQWTLIVGALWVVFATLFMIKLWYSVKLLEKKTDRRYNFLQELVLGYSDCIRKLIKNPNKKHNKTEIIHENRECKNEETIVPIEF